LARRNQSGCTAARSKVLNHSGCVPCRAKLANCKGMRGPLVHQRASHPLAVCKFGPTGYSSTVIQYFWTGSCAPRLIPSCQTGLTGLTCMHCTYLLRLISQCSAQTITVFSLKWNMNVIHSFPFSSTVIQN